MTELDMNVQCWSRYLQEDVEVSCVSCGDGISGQWQEHYSCRQCHVFLHKVCSEAPLVFTHSSHIHPLQLIPKNPSSNAKCKACGGLLWGLVYQCNLCEEFTVHLRCAGLNWKPDYSASPDVWKLNHVCHPHILTRERTDDEVVCAACLKDISGSGSGPRLNYYSCRKCDFFLHSSCARQPREWIHSAHPEHTLKLLQTDSYGPETSFCTSCQKPLKGFIYDCHCNQFTIHFNCAFPSNLEKRIQNHEQLHRHPLIFCPRASKISCDFCLSATGDEGEEEQSYVCSTCDFMIHRSCALADLTGEYNEHPHPLSVEQGVPADLQIYGAFYCDACNNMIRPDESVSHCARCRYFVHARCVMANESKTYLKYYLEYYLKKDAVDYLNDSLIQILLNGNDYVHWPQSDVPSELIQPFLLGKNGIVMNAHANIRHSSHKAHDMVFFKELFVNNDSFFKEEDDEILCDGCIHPITAPYYCCQECNYYLHLPCANLPQKFYHFGHPHELDLTYRLRFFYNYNCGHCGSDCNGFSYWCETCNFHIDVTCAALPSAIIHKSHEHGLVQTKQVCEGLCYCCKRYELKDDIIFKCRSCDVYLHYNCAMYSKSIRHRWDRQHPLDLRYPPHEYHPNHFMCDMCEELIHPLRRLYSCFECEVSFHTDCTPKYQKHPNVKYGGKMKISCHPHILKHLMKATLKVTCDKCEVPFGPSDVFECETCYYCICVNCVIKEANDLKVLRIKS